MRNGNNRGLDFNTLWESCVAKGYHSVDETFILGAVINSLEEAIKSLVRFLGLDPMEGTHKLQSGATTHNLLMNGFFRGGKEVLARIRLALNGTEVTLHLSLVCQDPDVSELIISSIG